MTQADVATTAVSEMGAAGAYNEAPASAPNPRTETDVEISNLSPRAIPKKKFVGTAPGPTAEEPATTNARDVQKAKTAAPAETTSSKSLAEPLAETPEEFCAVLDEHPQSRSAWEDETAYRESFASPEEVRQAIRLVDELNRLDALFFSTHPQDHAELAQSE